ncbi:MAG: glycosyltransferase family 2 protein [Planctomycetota bacterium]|jgi:glycosyltransferase involved in cell wall biosynthesis
MNVDNLPFVSIIVPVYNGEKTLGGCIESLLSQSYPKNKYEIIIVDNNSKDRTAETIKKYPVKYVMEDKIQSSYAARNTGAEIAKGEAFAFFDADQIADKDWLIKLLRGWEQKEFGAFIGKVIRVNSKNNFMGKYWQNEDRLKNIDAKMVNSKGENFIRFSGGNTVCRKNVFEMLNGFDKNSFSLEDVAFGLRLQKQLRLSIKFNQDAIAYHMERNTLEALLGVECRVGFGAYSLGCKSRDFKESICFSALKTVKRTILGSCALFHGIFKPLNGKSRKDHLLTILLDIVLRWANLLGRLQCFVTKGKRAFPAHW